MANYSQPPYGMPLNGVPPPNMVPPPANGPHDQRQAAVADAFQYNSNLPGLNFQGFGHNAPGHYQQFWNPLQSGVFPPLPLYPHPYLGQNNLPIPPPPGPPPPPLYYNPTAHLPVQSSDTASPTKAFSDPSTVTHATTSTAENGIAANNRILEISEADKEEGELSEGDRVSESPASRNTNRVDPPRSVAHNKHDQFRASSRNDSYRPNLEFGDPFPNNTNHSPVNSLHSRPISNLGQPNSEMMSPRPLNPKAAASNPILQLRASGDLEEQRDRAKKWISILNQNKVSYEQLLEEGLDPQILGSIYKDLSIPTALERMSKDTPAHVRDMLPTNGQPKSNAPHGASESAHAPQLSSNVSASQAAVDFPLPPPPTTTTTTAAAAAAAATTPQATSNTRALNSAQVKPIVTSIPNVSRTTPVTSAPSPIDRKDYIARLQAAKKGKQPAASKPAVQDIPAASATSGTCAKIIQPQPVEKLSDVTSNVQNVMSAAEKRKAQTELARQKLEAIAIASRKAGPPTLPQSSAVLQSPAVPLSTGAASAPLSRTSSFSSAIHTSEQENEPGDRPINSTTSSAIPVNTTSISSQNGGFQNSNKSFSPPSVLSSSFNGIPGLFMTASPTLGKATQTPTVQIPPSKVVAAPIHVPNVGKAPSAIIPRKRPVASDLYELEDISQPANPVKRQFGQSRHDHDNEAMIIEVSDDETAGSDMDIDEEQTTTELPVPLSNSGSQTPSKQAALRNLPQLTDFPSRATSVNPVASTVSTPPAVQTPGGLAHLQDLKKHEEEIAKLRRMIAEKERRKAMNKGKPTEGSRAPTPVITQSIVAQQVPTQQISLSPVVVPLQATNPAAVPHATPPTNQGLTISKDAEDSRPDDKSSIRPSSNTSTQWKQVRRAEIESNLPSLDASLARDAARMEQLRKEMEQLEAEQRRRAQDKENLIKELESLGIDTEGMPHAELQAKKDEIVQQRETETPLLVEAPEPGASSIAVNKLDIVSEQEVCLEERKRITPAPVHQPLVVTPEVQARFNTLLNSAPTEPPPAACAPPSPLVTTRPKSPFPAVESASQTTNQNASEMIDIIMNEDSAPELTVADKQTEEIQAVTPEPVEESRTVRQTLATLEDCSAHNDTSEASGDDMEMSDNESEKNLALDAVADLSSAVPEALETSLPENAPGNITETAAYTEPTSPPLEDDTEDFYSPEPDLPAFVEGKEQPTEESLEPHVFGTDQATETPPEEGEIEMSTSSSDGEEDYGDYEPPDARPESNIASEAGPEDDYEPSDALPEVSPGLNTESAHQFQETPHKNKSRSPSADAQSIAFADDIAPELQPETGQQIQASITQPVESKATVIEYSHFVPYESPLRQFKSYRYHPDYSKNVSGGFRSITYSHQIDPNKPICQIEAAGDPCNDDQCDNQHFRGMGLSGDMILVQLGTANPGRTEEEKQQWTEGLKLVLRQLRQKDTKDPDVVATEIANFRRQFLKDPTRVLNL